MFRGVVARGRLGGLRRSHYIGFWLRCSTAATGGLSAVVVAGIRILGSLGFIFWWGVEGTVVYRDKGSSESVGNN